MNSFSNKTIAYTNWIDFAKVATTNLSDASQYVLQAPVEKQGLLQLMIEASLVRNGLTVVVDVDDTLMDTTPRSQAIAQYLLDHTNARLPLQAPTVHALEQYVAGAVPHYFFGKALLANGADPNDIARCEAAWVDQFFTSQWLHRETPISGAVEYMQALASLRARIVYLTGRDTPYMGVETERVLHSYGLLNFHLDTGNYLPELITKPHYRNDDTTFKASVMARLIVPAPRTMALIENEPKNLRVMHQQIGAVDPRHQHRILLDTVRASDPDIELTHQGLDFSFPKDFTFPSQK